MKSNWNNAKPGDTIGKEQSKHTPVPWVFAYGSIYQGDNLDSLSEGSVRIAMMDRNESRTMPTERDANAEFICRAVNAHANLLEACKMVLACDNYTSIGPIAKEFSQVLRIVETAVQKAGAL